MIQSPWRAPLLWELQTANQLPAAASAYRVAGAFRGALLEALGDEGWLIAEDRTGRPASILAIPSAAANRIVAVGVALRATVADDATPILREAANEIGQEGFGRSLYLGRQVTMSKLTGPSDSWRTLTPWIALKSLSRAAKGKGKSRTPESLLHESVGRALHPEAQPAEAIAHAASLLAAIEITPHNDMGDARDWTQPSSAHPPYTAFARLAFRAPVQGPLLVGRGQYQGCGLLIADD